MMSPFWNPEDDEPPLLLLLLEELEELASCFVVSFDGMVANCCYPSRNCSSATHHSLCCAAGLIHSYFPTTRDHRNEADPDWHRMLLLLLLLLMLP